MKERVTLTPRMQSQQTRDWPASAPSAARAGITRRPPQLDFSDYTPARQKERSGLRERARERPCTSTPARHHHHCSPQILLQRQRRSHRVRLPDGPDLDPAASFPSAVALLTARPESLVRCGNGKPWQLSIGYSAHLLDAPSGRGQGDGGLAEERWAGGPPRSSRQGTKNKKQLLLPRSGRLHEGAIWAPYVTAYIHLKRIAHLRAIKADIDFDEAWPIAEICQARPMPNDPGRKQALAVCRPSPFTQVMARPPRLSAATAVSIATFLLDPFPEDCQSLRWPSSATRRRSARREPKPGGARPHQAVA
ncbi:MAG: hypothetical protein M1822_001885 [Bathelium mastoideum]|nr:MAG: hypothetical protein M1822_001885 [Bathelium mastoideum]